MVLMAVGTGLRRSELFALKWKDVDFAANHLSVTRSIVSQVVGVCKTEASQNPVPLHESLAQALLEWHRHTSFRKREDWVFASPHSNGKRPYWAQAIMRYHVAPASRRIQLQKRVGWHTFRHTYTPAAVVAFTGPILSGELRPAALSSDGRKKSKLLGTFPVYRSL